LVNLILSLDYEIFGNGSGDVQQDMIEPTQRLMKSCNQYGAKLSIMPEVAEYWAMKKAEEDGSLKLDYSPSRVIEDQIQSAVKCGHDVQLHLHPWWIGSAFKDSNWHLFPEYYRVTDLPNGLGHENDIFSIVGALHQGKKTLEEMIHPICPEYECLVYRAAMFWGQPSRELIVGLKKAGLIADSSVIKGLHETAPVPTDYRHAESATNYWWTNAEDISLAGEKGDHIIEFPVYSQVRPYLCNFKLTKLCATLKRRHVEKSNAHGHGMMEARRSSESPGKVLGKLLSRYPIKYDFCKLSANDMIRWLQRVIKYDQEEGDSFGTPVVMLGHSKDYWNDRNLEKFLRYIDKDQKGKVRFSTLGELAKHIRDKDT